MEFLTFVSALTVAAIDVGRIYEANSPDDWKLWNRRRRQVQKFRSRVLYKYTRVQDELDGALVLPKK